MVGSFLEFRFINSSWPVPQGEGERKVMDLQDVSATLEHPVAKQHPSFWHIFASSHRWCSSGQRRGHDSIDDGEGFSSEDNNDSEEDAELMTVTLKTAKKRKVLLQVGLGERW